MKTIALFGGSFDPPHIGHEKIVKALLTRDDIDKIIVMPTYLNPFKDSSLAPASQRLEWLKEIFSSSKKVEVSSYEVDLHRKVSTYETVKYFLKTYNKIHLVIGADNLQNLHKWNKADELKKLVTFIVASRETIEIPSTFLRLDVEENISSSSLRKEMKSEKLPQINRKKIAKFYNKNKENNE